MKKLLVLCALLPCGSFAQTWNQIGLDIDGEAADDRSGRAVSMPDVHTVAIGAYYNDGNGNESGQVRIYAWDGSTWIQRGADLDGEAAGDWSGHAVSMPDSNTVAIGAPNNSGFATAAGHVRVYAWDGGAWLQKGADLDGDTMNAWAGRSVSMPDASTVAFGAYTGDMAGRVQVYSWTGTSWLQKGADILGEAAVDLSGCAVSMPDSNTVAIGAYLNDGNGTDAGHVRVYAWSGSTWGQKGNDLDAEVAGDQAGWSVSMPDSNTVAVGAHVNDGSALNAGQVRIYVWNGSTWVQKGADLDGESTDDWFGHSVSMPDSNTVAIGSYRNDDNGILAGHARVYAWGGSAWIQVDQDLDGEAGDDQSGWSVSMPDAYTVAIGAGFNDGNGSNSGHVRVFSTDPAAPIWEHNSGTLAAYPSPTTGPLTVELRKIRDAVVVVATNALGQEVSRMKLNPITERVTLSLDGPSGVYIVSVRSGDGVEARLKVFKQ